MNYKLMAVYAIVSIALFSLAISSTISMNITQKVLAKGPPTFCTEFFDEGPATGCTVGHKVCKQVAQEFEGTKCRIQK